MIDVQAQSGNNVDAGDMLRKPAKCRATEAPRSTLPPHVAAQLLVEYTPIVRQIAGGFQRRLPCNVLRDDLVAAGMSGLWDAIRKHGDDRSGSFDWYVRVRIRGAILDELRAQDWLPRRARAAAAEAAKAAGNATARPPVVVRFDEVSETEQARCLVASDSSNTDREIETREVRLSLARAVEQLPERERHIVSLHYFQGVKFKDLGRMLGVSEPRISQLHSRAMGRLKTIMGQMAA
ncbi:MAG TPA: sigma-70 family RNA polymerase sigma factor [Polyangiaceae bacterium]|jgi:RNA polymerase sigma factor for flagellar operon FliA|nr:sigma-70 family RNA polymerase sigma factor [Polyangiaceae bacterium]